MPTTQASDLDGRSVEEQFIITITDVDEMVEEDDPPAASGSSKSDDSSCALTEQGSQSPWALLLLMSVFGLMALLKRRVKAHLYEA